MVHQAHTIPNSEATPMQIAFDKVTAAGDSSHLTTIYRAYTRAVWILRSPDDYNPVNISPDLLTEKYLSAVIQESETTIAEFDALVTQILDLSDKRVIPKSGPVVEGTRLPYTRPGKSKSEVESDTVDDIWLVWLGHIIPGIVEPDDEPIEI